MSITTRKLNVIRYLDFEINNTCDMGHLHPKCPNRHPERYRFGDTANILTDEIIMAFWEWCRFNKGFRGIVLWHGYSEPTLELDRIYRLMDAMKKKDPWQAFRLLTNKPPTPEMEKRFDMIKFTNYDNGAELDDRITGIIGEGKPYSQVQRYGWCGRGFGWDTLIDYHGNWNLCCNDWRCEESVGNIFKDDWDELMAKFEDKGRKLKWSNEEEYSRLPRMCRACIDVAWHLHRSGGI